jgi:hypothetical protein
MADQRLLTIFIALTSAAVLIQTGILVGFYFLSSKVSKQANRAVEQTQNLFGPMNRLIETLQTASNRMAEVSATAQGSARDLHLGVAKAQESWRQTLNRIVRPSA